MQKQRWGRNVALMAVVFLLAACSSGHHAPPPTPVITAQPADVSVVAGNLAAFSVTATGTTPAYQWQTSNNSGVSWADIAGATAASYTLATTTLSDSGHLFRVLVTAAGATVASSPAQLTVTTGVQAPAITVQPMSQTVTEPGTATFSVTATGTSLQYRWQLSADGSSWNDISSATSSSYTTPATSASASGAQFRVLVSNTAGSVTSNAVVLTINPASSGNAAPSFTTQPASQSVAEGSSATFTASATGTPTPTLQWQRSNNGGGSWVDISGETNNSYTTSVTVAGNSGAQFRVVATNSEGSVNSNVATLTVTAANAAPVFTTQPQDASVTAGSSAHFSVVASGVPTPTFQWQVSSDNGTNWINITGATSASYTTPATAAGDNGKRFRAVASNSSASVNSNAALLTVSVSLTAVIRPLSAGGGHSCALQADRTVACWGHNSSGELGDGGATDGSAPDRLTPFTVSGLTDVVSIVAGNSLSCALKTGGTVACWGSNLNGALGDGSTNYHSTPIAVSGLTSVVAIAASNHSCALKADGSVACWGSNSSGQVGIPVTPDKITAPVMVDGIAGVVAVATGWTHTCALKADGTAACWGDNSFGQLGTGHGTTSTPDTVSGLTNAVAIGAGMRHSCALKADGTVDCWGNNNTYGELGDGSGANSIYPVSVSGLTDAAAIAVGYSHTCALKVGGTVVCWGLNDVGQLGDGSTSNRATPVAVSGLSDVVAIAAGNLHSCALKTDGTVVCWGYNGDGRLGDNSSTNRLTPVAVSGGAVFWK
ncbi:RCC1 domain-containing protein [Stenotrophobium rhamnosiphilum]|nr:RCC1 domain-containing protein [Stenotrophobium rhamnosiphilum]